MSNMSYCRFQNTLHDLMDCAGALEDREPLSADEMNAARRLLELCKTIADGFTVEDLRSEDAGEVAECEDCGAEISDADVDAFHEKGGAPRGQIPEVCGNCADYAASKAVL